MLDSCGAPRNFVHVKTLILRIAFCNPGNLASTLRYADLCIEISPMKDHVANVAVRRACKGPGFSIVCRTSENSLTKLRISRAYFKLMCIPEGDARTISIAWIGSFEVRMHDVASTSGGKEPLFVLELFDHDSQSSIDSRICCNIAEGAATFETFVSR